MSCTELEQKLESLKGASMLELKTLWRAYFNEDVPGRNKATLAMKLAYRMQEIKYGGLRPQTLEFLRAVQPAKKPRASKRKQSVVGTQLRREYLGQIHRVTVVQNGYNYEGQIYKSLNAIAKHITGTTWNGYLFFGLAKRG
ncbi:DUF2924 domain-containing protein [Bartonella sp. DGB2]|uniref:DUF2924 domain-containing protein n=1 Tax=Bartonella sp. DGB2 TaxID=3388426 RepID=UPI003990148C